MANLTAARHPGNLCDGSCDRSRGPITMLAYITALGPEAGGDGIEVAVAGHGSHGQALTERMATW